VFFVSVIIPTYNRKASLLRLLDSLTDQTLPVANFEVIVVDDGGSDGSAEALQLQYPFAVHFLRQKNQGVTAARNYGSEFSKGDYLIFMDDDIELSSDALRALVQELLARPNTIILGSLILPDRLQAESVFAENEAKRLQARSGAGIVPFTECMTGLLAVKKQDFLKLGMFQDPTGGWPNWDDVDFGYRAHQAGFEFWRTDLAVANHWDYSVLRSDLACRRLYRAAHSAPRLFQTHPPLKDEIHMFHDKEPVDWRLDSTALIGQKLARRIVSSPLSTRVMEKSTPYLETHWPRSPFLKLLYRWITSAYIFHGYRDGLRELALQ
jgi:glycosyltransferase involved in cell wall biosynthesis